MELVNIQTIGNKYSWISSYGGAISRLDKILFSEGIIDWWKLVGHEIANIDISNHCFVRIKRGELNWEPNPFIINKCWSEHDHFIEFVRIK